MMWKCSKSLRPFFLSLEVHLQLLHSWDNPEYKELRERQSDYVMTSPSGQTIHSRQVSGQ